MAPLLGAAPLAVVLALMLGLRWRAAPAGAAGAAIAAAIAVWVFGLGTAVMASLGPVRALAGAGLEALFTTATVLWIVLPALALYELQSRSGALETLRSAVGMLAGDVRTQVLLVAWFFGLFMEGAAGFGAPVALTAPILVALGHSPIRAVTLALVGHSAGVSFGALGTPVLAQGALVGIDPGVIAGTTAVLHVLVGWTLLAALVWLAAETRPTRRDWLAAVGAGACFYVPFAALAHLAGPELPTIGGALIGAVVFAALLPRRGRRPAGVSGAAVARAAAPYLIIIALVLLTRLPPGVREGLSAVELAWVLDGQFRGAVQPLYHAGSLLAAGFLLGALLQGRSGAEMLTALSAALRRLAPVALALVAMLFLSRVMVHGGLVAALASGVAAVGPAWPLLAPSLGALGGFVTGSATASNILLSPFQNAAAGQLALPPAWMAAGQGLGAAFGNMVAPHNVVAGAATVGLQGREAEILRRTALVCAIALAAGGIVLWALLRLAPA